MNYKIINLVTDDYDKSIVFYGKYGRDENIQTVRNFLISEFDVKPKTFKLDKATIDFNSKERDWFEDKVELALKKYFEK